MIGRSVLAIELGLSTKSGRARVNPLMGRLEKLNYIRERRRPTSNRTRFIEKDEPYATWRPSIALSIFG